MVIEHAFRAVSNGSLRVLRLLHIHFLARLINIIFFHVRYSIIATAKMRGHSLPQEYDMARFFRGVREPPEPWFTEASACKWTGVTCNNQNEIK